VLISIFFVDCACCPDRVGRLPIGILCRQDDRFLLVDTLLAGKPDCGWLAVKQLTLPA